MIVKINKIPDSLFYSLKDIIKDRQVKANNDLAGNIEEEFNLNKYIPLVENYILQCIDNNKILIDYMKSKFLTNTLSKPMVLNDLWVNFQKKYEFNPLHKHTGVFSFILFIQIPYSINDLDKMASVANSNLRSAGRVEFLTYDSNGELDPTRCDVDKTWEQTGLIFPANLYHTVYPFYGTDEYRITMSGNILFKVN